MVVVDTESKKEGSAVINSANAELESGLPFDETQCGY